MTVASASRGALPLLCAAIMGCAIDHREQNGNGNPDDPIDPVETQIEILEGATWPEGLWIGDTHFPIACRTQSSRVSIRFNPGSSGVNPSAFAVFGEQEKIPAEADPAQGYPEKHVRQSDQRCGRDELYDGYPYQVRAATVWPTGRMTLWISADELYDEWCALQTSYPGAPSETAWFPEREQWDHTCIDLPVDEYWKCGGDPDYCPVNYDQFKMCDGRYCRCTEAGCRAPQFKSVRLDMLVADDVMEGVIESMLVKLRRVE
jgi:hypothetical protein